MARKPTAEQPTKRPSRKVTSGGFAGVATTLIIAFVHEQWNVDLDPVLVGGLVSLAYTTVAYWVKEWASNVLGQG